MKLIRLLAAAITLSAMLSGCASESEQEKSPSFQNETASAVREKEETAAESEEIKLPSAETVPETEAPASVSPATVLCPDWASYFGELNGAAVIFAPDEYTVQIYNEDLADTRRSPCSTFKIISSLVGLENGVIDPENSTRSWSGEIFWNDDWNRDIDFLSAFQTSCVWYYRQVIDEIGSDGMKRALDDLQYGNCDISDWEGHLNNNNSNPALTGFWIESSLKISPREQTEVMERIFGSSSKYSSDTRALLEKAMFYSEGSDESCAVYGKTGMEKSEGTVVDCWYTGFADVGHRIYFCIYLGETPGQNVSSSRAREIAVSLIKDNF